MIWGIVAMTVAAFTVYAIGWQQYAILAAIAAFAIVYFLQWQLGDPTFHCHTEDAGNYTRIFINKHLMSGLDVKRATITPKRISFVKPFLVEIQSYSVQFRTTLKGYLLLKKLFRHGTLEQVDVVTDMRQNKQKIVAISFPNGILFPVRQV